MIEKVLVLLGAVVFAGCPAAQEVETSSGRLVSWSQPDTTGPFGWNGRCGETAVANVATNVCGHLTSPDEVVEQQGDLTPGNRPSTVARAITSIEECGLWVVEQGCPADPCELSRLAAEAELMPALVHSGGLATLHYVTVSGVDACSRSQRCEVEYLEDGMVDRERCDQFMERWGLRGMGLRDRVLLRVLRLRPCTRIVPGNG